MAAVTLAHRLAILAVLLGCVACWKTVDFTPRPVPEPPADWIGWRDTNRDDRFINWLAWIQFNMLPSFTDVGYKLMDMPKDIHEKLMKRLHQYVAPLQHAYPHTTHALCTNTTPCSSPLPFRYNESTPLHEGPVNIIENNGDAPGFISQEDLNREILQQLKGLHEEWCGVELEPSWAFGLRVYHNGNVLKRHVDRVETHVISAILHIDHDTDEPWPIVIADNTGVEHAVDLPAGKMLFYESARLPHARPTPMKGKYYSSLFVHYRPKEWPFTDQLTRSRLPAGWDRDIQATPKVVATAPIGKPDAPPSKDEKQHQEL
jgi:hypothetical protein